MNKLAILFLVLLPSCNSWSQAPVFMTRIEMGYPHAGSYQKERPSFGIEHSFIWLLNRKLFAGVGSGFAVYPAAYTVPVYLQGGYKFPIKGKYFLWEHRIGANLRVGQNSFFNYRYNTTLSYTIRLTRKMTGYAGLGTNFIWDRWGGKSLSGVASVSVLYVITKPPKKTEPVPRQNKDNPPW